MADFLIVDNDKNKIDRKENKTNILDSLKFLFASFSKIKTKDKVQFFRLMSTMLNSWLSLVKAVSVLEKQQKKWKLKEILVRFIYELNTWKKLSECFELFPNDFTQAEVWMVKSWEKTWQLNSTLLELAVQTERLSSINWKIKSAMTYPAFIVLVVFWVIYVIMTKVVPELLKIFWDKSTLPTSTKNLMFVSDFLVNYWLYLIILLVILYIIFLLWKRTPTWAYISDKILFKIPIFGSMTQKIVLSKFARIFSWLIWSWVSVIESMKITAEAVWNEVYKQRILLSTEDIASGIKMWESLDNDELFPDMMIQMIQVWEETAKLEDTIIKVADYYDEEVDNTISSINKLLEPFIIVTLAVVVWWIAISILEPIMNLADTVSNQ